jgi:putative LysE/RhtB family amino acid efflux pump
MINEAFTVDWGWLATWYLPAGVLIGIAAAAPIGPVNLLVIQRTLQRGPWSAFLLGLGGALGDAAFAVAAAFGISAIEALISQNQALFRLFGGLVMLGFGVFVWRSAPHLNAPIQRVPRTRHMALATFLMTVTNPATILWFIATFGTIGFHDIGQASDSALYHSSLLVLGVFVGSLLWWLFVISIALRLRSRLADRHLVMINHLSAGVLLVFGAAALLWAAELF